MSKNIKTATLKNGNWHGNKFYFGLHFDLHAEHEDTELGTELHNLEKMLKIAKPDFVQTDCKGHPGYLSWFSKVPESSIPPNLKHDCLKEWRRVSKKLGMPLHCHYSGIFDTAYAKKHPDYCQIDDAVDKSAVTGQNSGAPAGEKMCVRSPYTEKLMIPHMLDAIDNYQVDGFWIDGDMWACKPCYCEKCKKAFTDATGLEVPYKESETNWPAWWLFSLKSFYEYVNRYCDAVHKKNPKVLVCSNWLHTLANPGNPETHVDWISGDNTQTWGMDGSRAQCRFISTRGKHWDLMIWNFSSRTSGAADAPYTPKPVEMMMQEVAVPISLGGSIQIYETEGGLRSGRFVDWHMKRIAEIAKFIRKRQALCQDSESIPQVAVLHSESHVFGTVKKKNLMWAPDTQSTEGACFAMLENAYSTDILDEWALLPKLNEYTAVVVPESECLSNSMLNALKDYVKQGGRLILSGALTFDRFGKDFIGAQKKDYLEEQTYFVPAADGAVPVTGKWILLEAANAKSLGKLGITSITDDKLLSYEAATLNKVGKGYVAYIPCNIFRSYRNNRYPLLRKFIGTVAQKTIEKLPLSVKCPSFVDVVLRRKGNQTIIQLLNRNSGRPNTPNDGIIDEIPQIGPIEITLKTDKKPLSVKNAWESGKLSSSYKNGTLKIKLSHIHIHEAVVIKN